MSVEKFEFQKQMAVQSAVNDFVKKLGYYLHIKSKL